MRPYVGGVEVEDGSRGSAGTWVRAKVVQSLAETPRAELGAKDPVTPPAGPRGDRRHSEPRGRR